MLVPQTKQLVNVFPVHLVHIGLVRVFDLLNLDGTADDNVHGPSVGHQADVVVEDAACVEDGDRPAHEVLHNHLELVYPRMCVRVQLVVDVVLAKPNDGYKVGTVAYGELYETLTTVQDEMHSTGPRFKRLARATDNYGDGATHALTVPATLGEDVFARFPRHGSQSHAEGILAVQRQFKVTVQGQKRIRDAREKLGKAKGFGGKGCECAVRDDAVRVVAKDVLARGLQDLRTVQAGGEVGGEERPHARAAAPFAAIRQFPRRAGVGEEHKKGVWEDEGPQDGYGAEEEEDAHQTGDAERVHQHSERLQAALERHIEWGKADSAIISLHGPP